jgi:ABC-type sugar transport system ATPase subunit
MSYLHIENVRKTYNSTVALAGVDIDVERGEFLALLGPSGCGKTTLLRIIAGLLDANGGRLVLDERDITNLPPWKRDIGLVFQNYALFPHMSVRRNVGFGLEMRRLDQAVIARSVDEALELVRLGDLADRRPSELSGGQQQRVAIARAIVLKPRLLLLDEPLSNLDAVLRNSVRVELRELHQRTGLTTVMVTHDQSEALTLADRVAVMSAGAVLQHDSAETIYEQPRTAFVASFVGSPPANLLLILQASDGTVSVGGTPWEPPLRVLAAIQGIKRRSLQLALRPEALTLVAPGTPQALKGTIKTVEYMGSDRLVHVSVGDAMVQVRASAATVAQGVDVGISVPDAAPIIFDPATGERLTASQPEIR